jgi:outer membrane protein
MKISSVARKASAIMVAMAALGAAAPSQAQVNSIFPPDMSVKVRDRLFMRLGYVTAFLKTKSEDVKDLTGPVVTRQQLADAFARGISVSQACAAIDPDNGGVYGPECYTIWDGSANGFIYGSGGAGQLLDLLDKSGLSGIGTPAGIKAKAQSRVGTPVISMGYWLDDDFKWLLEAYVLGAPLSVKLYGAGVRQDGTPNSISGKHIATTKLLPPVVIGSYNFGNKNSMFRPWIGVGGMYAIFFDARATPFLEDYVGGKTTITTQNTFGFGPFAGIQSAVSDDWHVNLSVGQVTLKATSKLVTTGTQINSGAAVLSDLPTEMARLINVTGESLWSGGTGNVSPAYFTYGTGFTTTIMNMVKEQKGTSELGTYVREQKMKITNTLVTLSVGRSF